MAKIGRGAIAVETRVLSRNHDRFLCNPTSTVATAAPAWLGRACCGSHWTTGADTHNILGVCRLLHTSSSNCTWQETVLGWEGPENCAA